MAAKKKPKAQQASSDAEPQLSRFQAFETRRMCRRELASAPYNPRALSDAARKNLKRNLDSDHGGVGLLGPVTWNETTGFVVGGHQRLAALDALEGSDNYLLDVAVVRLTEKQEREQNIALNNDRLSADWDLDLLAPLLKSGIDLEFTGWTPLDISITFAGDDELAGIFGLNEPTANLLAEVQAMQDDGKPEPKPPKREIMKETRARNEDAFAGDDTEIYAVVTFLTRTEREIFMHHCGADSDDRYIDGSLVVAKMGAELEETMRAAAPKPKPPPAKKKGKQAKS